MSVKKEYFVLKIYQSKNTVFTIKDLALLFPGTERANLKAKTNYYVKKGVLKSLRRGVYAKSDYNFFELATKIYTPSYISFETVLAREGIIFQHYKTVFVASYLSRKIKVAGIDIQFRRLKENILLDRRGILQKENYAEASKERAFLDALYLYKDYHFDNLDALDRKKVFSLLLLYQSKALAKKIKGIFKNA